MACIQYPRKERGGVSLGSWEKPTIYREPPKEIFTKKKERVEEGDVTYNIRNDSSRYNDAITNWQKGKNMMVQVDYQNRAPQTTTMNFGSASNPYKVNQAFRPPEFKLLDLQPLSRQQRPYVAGQTNIGSQITRNDSSEIRNDQRLIDFSIGANPTLHTANTNASREMGIYYDNHERSDAVHQDMSFVDITSALKGIENVELQKMFSYEQTPHGIVMVPLYVNAESSASGPVNVESQRHLSDIISYLQDQLKYSQESNQSGVLNYDAQRTLPNQNTFISTDGKILGQGDSSLSGPANYEAQRHLQTEAYLQNQLIYGQGTNTSGYKDYEAQRNLSDTLSYLQQQRQYTEQGTNLRGRVDVEAQRHLSDTISYLQERLQVGLGTNATAPVKYNADVDLQEKVKEVLLKNMTSNVSIVIRMAGSADEYAVKGSIQDKIGIVVDSSKGTPLQLSRDHGEPIKLKDYTWKFVKSAMGADKFVIQLDHQRELQLDRNVDLYAVYSNMGNVFYQSGMNEEVNLRREAMNISASSNVTLLGDIDRVDESQFNRIEKLTHYTDHMIAADRPSLLREDTTMSSIRISETGKKQNIQNMILRQSEGRF